uniref:Cnidarian restricted protein n=1 Tax=Clytia hemisphaerica TaxID=252671 RepID=A0A7M5XHC9_9CNID
KTKTMACFILHLLLLLMLKIPHRFFLTTDTFASSTTVYVSPKGRDEENCGLKHKKCQTVDYVLKESNNSNLKLILENLQTQSIVYHTQGMLRPDSDYFQLRITKENQNETNPTIYGNGLPFIQPKGAFSLSIDQVDLQSLVILNSTNQNSSMAISFRNLNIRTELTGNFISTTNTNSNLNVTVQSCVLISPTRNAWLNISMKK